MQNVNLKNLLNGILVPKGSFEGFEEDLKNVNMVIAKLIILIEQTLEDFQQTSNLIEDGVVTIKNIRDFEKAREYVRTLGIKSAKAWKEYCKSGKNPKIYLTIQIENIKIKVG